MRRVGTLGLVAALAAILVSPLPAHAEDASGAVTYNAGNGYSFEKLSHPTVGTSQPDGIVDYQGNGAVAVPGADGNTANNEGDRGQSYTWAAASYGDWLYVGTCYAAMGNTLTLMNSTLGDSFDVETMRLTLEAMFNGTFFYGQQKEDGTADKDSGGILVKINTKTGETKLLLSESLNGVAPLFRNAVSYKGKLYFCGSVRTNTAKAACLLYTRSILRRMSTKLSIRAFRACRITVLPTSRAFLPVSAACASMMASSSSVMWVKTRTVILCRQS